MITNATTKPAAKPRYGFVIDNRSCIGCHACTVACKAEHGDPIGVNKTWVSYIEKGVFPDVRRAFHVMRCNHCADAPCVEICPTTSLTTRDDGIVDFDPERCIGCKACMQACPYDAIMINPDSGTATKCNYCAHRIDSGREPACVVVCPTQAIVVGDLDDPGSRIARLVAREDVTVRKPEKGTRPKLFYVGGDEACLNPAATIIPRDTLWGSKAPDQLDRSLVESPTSPQISATQRGLPRRTYDIAQRHTGSWGWKVSAYLFTKSIAAGVILLPAVLTPLARFDHSMGAAVLVALLALAVTGALLVADLKRPERFHWVLLRPQWRSWLVRGAYIIAGYGALLPVLGWMDAGHARDLLFGVTALLAAGTAAYSGWLFGQARGRDFWQSPLVPAQLLVQALVAGAAVFLLLRLGNEIGVFRQALAVCLGIHLLFVGVDVWGRHATADATTAARILRRMGGGVPLGAVIGVGHLLPWLLLGAESAVLDGLAGLLALAGVALYEHLWISAPQRLPLA